MRSRMDRYKEVEKNISTDDYSRSNKNQVLYSSLGDNKSYTSFSDVSDSNTVDITKAAKNYKSREGYHKIKEYDNLLNNESVKKEIDQFKYIHDRTNNKNYDLNSVLEEAKRNRKEDILLEEKRKLKNTNYNILAVLNPEEVEKYQQIKNSNKPNNDENLRELIDTITSKTLAGDIDKKTSVNLLSELMATSNIEVNDLEDKSIEEKEDKLAKTDSFIKKEDFEKQLKLEKTDSFVKKEELKDMDKDFYTRSMDLSDKDFDLDMSFEEKKVPVALTIFLILIFIGVLVGVGLLLFKVI